VFAQDGSFMMAVEEPDDCPLAGAGCEAQRERSQSNNNT
jgi:hypothetical protein